MAIDNLVMLLGAESSDVRQAIQAELGQHLPELEQWFQENQKQIAPEVQFQICELLTSFQHKAFRQDWLDWLDLASENERLEAALSRLAQLDEPDAALSLTSMLDKLAEEAQEDSPGIDPFMLNRFLFVEGRFQGSRKDYLNPAHSNMIQVLSSGKGLPISLAMVFILVGDRLGFNIKGFNQPGHFLARADVDDRPYLFDCFDHGRILTNQDIYISTINSGFDLYNLLNYPPTAVDMISRVLCNLVNSYYRNGEMNNTHLCTRLLADLRKADPERLHLERIRNQIGAKFVAGALVRHKRYGYRGVVVDFDTNCQAEDEWYYANQTQPKRDQPWYYVLVSGSEYNTYVAESNLDIDLVGDEVDNPLIKTYFTEFNDGRYIRNTIPWQLPL